MESDTFFCSWNFIKFEPSYRRGNNSRYFSVMRGQDTLSVITTEIKCSQILPSLLRKPDISFASALELSRSMMLCIFEISGHLTVQTFIIFLIQY